MENRMTHYKGNQQQAGAPAPKPINQGGAKEMGGPHAADQQEFGKDAKKPKTTIMQQEE